MPIRSAFDGDRRPVILKCEGPGRTKQSFRDECDINGIMARFQRTGLIDAVNKIQPQYADVAGFDFQFAMNQIIQAQDMFAELPSGIRKRFQNDPAAFVEFVGDPANEEEARRLGLIREAVEQPQPAPAPAEKEKEVPPA